MTLGKVGAAFRQARTAPTRATSVRAGSILLIAFSLVHCEQRKVTPSPDGDPSVGRTPSRQSGEGAPANATRAEDTATEDRIGEARQLSDALQSALKSELMAAMKQGGPSAAIEVCQKRAPLMGAEVRDKRGKHTWTLSRTSLRVRNPDNAATEWQQRGLAELQGKFTTAAPGTPAEWHERAPDGGLRYLRAIEMGPLCVTCHGDPGAIPSEVKSKLAELYALDRATGFAVGELRGAFVVTAPGR